MGQTITKLEGVDWVVKGGCRTLAVATNVGGPASVIVVPFLKSKLANAADSLHTNVTLRTLIHASLGRKGRTPEGATDVMPVYLSALEEGLCLDDLLLCAALLQGDSLQLADGAYYQVTAINCSK